MRFLKVSVPDFEARERFLVLFLLLEVLHAAKELLVPQLVDECLEILDLDDRFHLVVLQIPYPALDAFPLRNLAKVLSEADALNAAAEDKTILGHAHDDREEI